MQNYKSKILVILVFKYKKKLSVLDKFLSAN